MVNQHWLKEGSYFLIQFVWIWFSTGNF